jgi:hypothetical protein
MNVFIFVLIIIFLTAVIGPLAKGIGDRIGRSGKPPLDEARLGRLAADLEAADQRLADAERRLHLAEERLDFQEKLLSARASRPKDAEPPRSGDGHGTAQPG